MVLRNIIWEDYEEQTRQYPISNADCLYVDPDRAECVQRSRKRPLIVGNDYLEKGELDRAISEYDQAIQLDPNLAAAYIERGFAYIDKGEFNRAISDFDQAIQLNPDDAKAYI